MRTAKITDFEGYNKREQQNHTPQRPTYPTLTECRWLSRARQHAIWTLNTMTSPCHTKGKSHSTQHTATPALLYVHAKDTKKILPTTLWAEDTVQPEGNHQLIHPSICCPHLPIMRAQLPQKEKKTHNVAGCMAYITTSCNMLISCMYDTCARRYIQVANDALDSLPRHYECAPTAPKTHSSHAIVRPFPIFPPISTLLDRSVRLGREKVLLIH